MRTSHASSEPEIGYPMSQSCVFDRRLFRKYEREECGARLTRLIAVWPVDAATASRLEIQMLTRPAHKQSVTLLHFVRWFQHLMK